MRNKKDKFIYQYNKKIKISKINIWWLRYFMPSYYLDSYKQVPLKLLKSMGIKCIICDLDNTIASIFDLLPNRDAIEFVKKTKANNMNFILVSNNGKERVNRFASKLDIEAYPLAKKPLLGSVKKIIKKHQYKKNEMIIIGDQLFTDIFLANRLKIKCILVLPLINKDRQFWIQKILNKNIYKMLGRANLLLNPSIIKMYNQEKWSKF